MVFHKINLEAVTGPIHFLHFTRRGPSATLKLSPNATFTGHFPLGIGGTRLSVYVQNFAMLGGGEGGGVNERAVGLRLVGQMSILSYRRKIRTFTFSFLRRVTSPQVQSPLNFSSLQTRVCCS